MSLLHVLHHLGVVRLLASGPVMTLTSPHRRIASIFMLHRFGKRANGHDPLVVRRLLTSVRRYGFEILDLEDLFRRLAGEGPPLRRAVAFTIDDGYQCQAEVAAPIFAEYGLPVTTFLATGFLDGELWLWWDQIEYILDRTPMDRVELLAGEHRLALDLGDADRRRVAAGVVAGHCKLLPDAHRLEAIAELSEKARVPIPETPPPGYRPMTWDQVRQCEAGGMRFGPHTVTHPVLARTEPEQARQEIERSWRRVSEEVARPMPVFCYPNGRRDDFGSREFDIFRSLGLLGAVTAEPGYATDAGFAESDGCFRVPRFSFSETHEQNLRYASRLEWLWQKLRPRGAVVPGRM